MDSRELILSALDYINPADLGYSDWVNVGKALKIEGFDVDVWDSWSRSDPRYKRNDCTKRWNGFKRTGGDVVTGGTIVQFAKDRGFIPHLFEDDGVMDWNSSIEYDGDIVTPQKEWNPAEELTRYIRTLFRDDEYVAYVTNGVEWDNDGERWKLNKGTYAKTAGQLLREIEKNPTDLGAAIGDWNKDAGAWIRFNPVDGKGVKNENVTRFTYALVESDEMPINEQDMMYRKLELPIATLVHSGGKSLHAIVHVDAKDAKEYEERVNFLYDFLEKNGLRVDKNNRNPSRLSRMPGVTRNGNRQYLAATNIGRRSWSEWMDYVEGATDELPDIVSFADIEANPPTPPPELIYGILRQGHKMLISGDSKAGKSFLLMELAISIAEGWRWIGTFPCVRGRVLYINLEIDAASAGVRFLDIYHAMGTAPRSQGNLDIWNLRGHATTLDKLVPKIIRRTQGQGYICIIIDPIYKVITGDENSASEMGQFCNQFDRICNETKCAVIYCHHHAKGAQGGKKAQDRASGSGVFARDPDALIDISELVISNFLLESKPDPDAKAFRIETSLREFRNIKPINVWFTYPIHIPDETGQLENAMIEGAPSQFYKMAPKYKPGEMRQNDFECAYDALTTFEPDTPVTIDAIAETMEISKKTVYRRIKECGDKYEVSNGIIKRKE